MPGPDHKLIVMGKVLTNAGNLVPVLNEAVPQGFNPQILMLNLMIEQQCNFETQDVSYRDARFEKPESAGINVSDTTSEVPKDRHTVTA